MQLPWRLLHRAPARASRPSAPTATTLLLALLVTCALAQAVWQRLGDPAADRWLDRAMLTAGGLKAGRGWQVLTHLLVNGGVGWLLPLSLATLALAGYPLEKIVGRRHLGQLFLLAGVAGGLGQVGFDALLGHDAPVAGPAASAMGLLLALTYVSPGTPIFPRARPTALRRVKVVHGTIGALAATVAAGTHPPTAGVLVGGLTGCLSMYALGFGRWTSEAEEVPSVSVSSSASWGQEAGQPKVLAAPVAAAKNAPTMPHRAEPERTLSTREFIAEKVDPVLEKISREGMNSLTAEERQLLEAAREKVAGGR